MMDRQQCGLSLFTLGLLICLAATVGCFTTAQDQLRFDEVKRISSTLPIHPELRETRQVESSAFRKAFLSRTFESRAPYSDVRKFYVEHLTNNGWQLDDERDLKEWGRNFGGKSLAFRRGEYLLTIEYAGDQGEKEWSYAIGVAWER